MSWFNRFIHRHDEMVRIIPDNAGSAQHNAADGAALPGLVTPEGIQKQLSEEHSADEPRDEPVEELAFATAYATVLTARIHDESSPQQTVTEEGAGCASKTMPAEMGESQDQDAEDVLVVGSREPRQELACPAEDRVEEVAAVPVVPPLYRKELAGSAMGRLAEQAGRQRPRRPLSFHELVGVKAKAVSATSVFAAAADYLPAGGPDATQEEAARSSMTAQEGSHLQHSPMEVSIPPDLSPTDALEAGTLKSADMAPDPLRPDPLRAENSILPEPLESSRSSGVRRWDPIPTLRPTDSGWHRIASSTSGTPQELLDADDWTWLGRGIGNVEEQQFDYGTSEMDSAADLDQSHDASEPALSRPWGLLSRFQQMQKIAPELKSIDPLDEEDSGETLIPGSLKASQKG